MHAGLKPRLFQSSVVAVTSDQQHLEEICLLFWYMGLTYMKEHFFGILYSRKFCRFRQSNFLTKLNSWLNF